MQPDNNQNNTQINNPMVQASVQSVISEKVPDYLVFSILVLVLFSLPFGIAALIMSQKVKRELALGNIVAAKKASKATLIINLVGFFVGVGLLLLIQVLKAKYPA